MVRRRNLRAHRHRQKGASTRCLALHMPTDLVSVFEKTQISCALQADASQIDLLDAANQLNLFDF